MKVFVVLVVVALCACGGRAPGDVPLEEEGCEMLRPPLTWAALQAKTSGFPQASNIIQIQPAVSHAQWQRVVKTESELTAAIGDLVAQVGAVGDTALGIGGEIIIAAPITLTATVVVPVGLPGLRIRGAGMMPVYAQGIVASAFDVRAPYVTIENLRAIVSPDELNYFQDFVRIGSTNAGFVRVLGNEAATERLYVDELGAADALVEGNIHVLAVGVFVDAPIEFIGAASILRNRLDVGSGSNAIVMTSGSQATISFNRVAGNPGAIVTTASSGENSVVGNRNVSLTLHADDEEAANTP